MYKLLYTNMFKRLLLVYLLKNQSNDTFLLILCKVLPQNLLTCWQAFSLTSAHDHKCSLCVFSLFFPLFPHPD